MLRLSIVSILKYLAAQKLPIPRQTLTQQPSLVSLFRLLFPFFHTKKEVMCEISKENSANLNPHGRNCRV